MKFKKTLVIGIDKSQLKTEDWDEINAMSEELLFLKKDSPEIKEHLPTTECLLVSISTVVDKQVIDSAPNLKYVSPLSTGYSKIDEKYAAEKGITVCNIPGYSTESVAEFAFAMLLEQMRELERGKNQARKGDYSFKTFFGVTEIKGKEFGVIGLGQIGGRIAEIALGFGANVSYWSRNKKPEYEEKGMVFKEADELISNSDILSLNLSLNKDTDNFVNEDRVKLIKNGAFIVNVSPHELINHKALVERLKKDEVYYLMDHVDEISKEEIQDLSQFKNCVIYPPIAFTSKEASAAKQKIYLDNIKNFFAGKPSNKVN